MGTWGKREKIKVVGYTNQILGVQNMRLKNSNNAQKSSTFLVVISVIRSNFKSNYWVLDFFFFFLRIDVNSKTFKI